MDGQPSLNILLQQLHAILQSIPILESHGYKPPIIDGDGHRRTSNPIFGLRIFKDAVSREVEILEQFLARPDHGSELSTNASYFVAVWNEILSAPAPIVAIGKKFDRPDVKKKGSTARASGSGGIKVDVVADEGRRWIRVNTIKNSRIMAEFREFDSYLTGSEDDSDGDEHFNSPTYQENSLLLMGQALVAASSLPIAGTNKRPSVTLRLTRLQPNFDGSTDPRITQTINSLRDMGLDVQLGEREFRSLYQDPTALKSASQSSVRFQPTRRINVDLSMLIALVSDLSHAELPRSENEAWARFRMPVNARSWKLGKLNAGDTPPRNAENSQEEEEYSKHSRALSTQCIQEMEHGLIEEVVERLKTVTANGGSQSEFWTTEEARDRCLQIVDKIGGDEEKRRAYALFPSSSVADVQRQHEDFWRGSRYSPSYFSSLLPIRIHASRPRQASRPSTSPFWGHLIQTCRHVLSQDASPHPRLYHKVGEMERARVTKANTKLTVHTVESMLVGVCEGMTTLTANKASVKALLRETKGVKQGGGDAEFDQSSPGEWSRGSNDRNNTEDGVAAAIWIVEPRSLAEGMRADRLLSCHAA